jgi:hypothetical protein
MDDDNDLDQSFGDESREGFLEACGKIQRNDPSCKVHVVSCYDYGRTLGRALRHNTHVERLRIDMDDFCSEREIAADQFRSGAQDVLRFLQRSQSLQNTQIRLFKRGSPHYDDLTEWILGAIAQNPSVRTVKLYGAIELLENFLTTAHFVQSLSISSYPASTATMDAIGVALASNRSLLKLTIRFDMKRDAPSWCPILLGLHSHPTLVDLELISSWYYGVYYDQAQHITSLSSYLCADTTILRRLKLNCFKFLASTMEPLMDGAHVTRRPPCCLLTQ